MKLQVGLTAAQKAAIYEFLKRREAHRALVNAERTYYRDVLMLAGSHLCSTGLDPDAVGFDVNGVYAMVPDEAAKEAKP